MDRRQLVTASSVLTVLSIVLPVPARAATADTIVPVGSTLGLAGVDFVSVIRAEMSDAGDASVVASLGGPGVTGDNDTAYLRWANGALTVVARSGDAVPGIANLSVPRAQIGFFGTTSDGHVLLSALVGGNAERVLWLQKGDDAVELSRAGAPCATDGALLQQGGAGATAFTMGLGGVVALFECGGVTLAGPAGRVEVPYPDPIPGSEGGGWIAAPELVGVDLEGQAWMRGDVTCTSCPGGFRRGLYRATSGGAFELAFDGRGHETVASLLSFGALTFNTEGDFAAITQLGEPGAQELAVVRVTDGVPLVIARLGDAPIDRAARPIELLAPLEFQNNIWLLDDGRVLFWAYLANPSALALLSSEGGAISTIFALQERIDEPLPDTLVLAGTPTINAEGRIVLHVTAEVPQAGVQNLVFADRLGALALALRAGDTMTVDGEGVTVSSFEPPIVASSGGTVRAGGQLTMALDGSVLMNVTTASGGGLMRVSPSGAADNPVELSLTLDAPDALVFQAPFSLTANVVNDTDTATVGEIAFTVLEGTLRIEDDVEGCVASEEVTGLVDVVCTAAFPAQSTTSVTLPLYLAGEEEDVRVAVHAEEINGGSADALYEPELVGATADLELSTDGLAGNYTLRVENLGPAVANNVRIVGDRNVCVNGCRVASTLEVGGVATFDFDVPEGTAWTITFTVSAEEPDPDASNNTLSSRFAGEGALDEGCSATTVRRASPWAAWAALAIGAARLSRKRRR